MDLKKLLNVLVVGGMALASTGCGSGQDEQQQGSLTNDGGTATDGGTHTGQDGGGPVGW